MTKLTTVSLGTFALCALTVLGAGCAANVGTNGENEEVAVSQQALFSTQTFSMTYSTWGGSSCSSSSHSAIKGYEPTTAGTYPVFVWLSGTQSSGAWDGAPDEDFIQYMAAQGFVAGDVDYDNTTYPTSCSTMTGKASCIYNTSSANSAISKLCSRPTADCVNKGIFVSGVSQGANLSSLAANYGAHMRAAYLVSNGDVASGFINLSGCLDKSHLTFTPSQLREVSGESDAIFGGSRSGVQSQLQKVSGTTCASGTYNCLQADGSGWFIVANSQVVDGKADHCYFLNGASSTCSTFSGMDANWDSGAGNWAKTQDLAWLAGK
jgi:hypothetical protein